MGKKTNTTLKYLSKQVGFFVYLSGPCPHQWDGWMRSTPNLRFHIAQSIWWNNYRQSSPSTRQGQDSSSPSLTVAEDNLAGASHSEGNHLYKLGIFWMHKKNGPFSNSLEYLEVKITAQVTILSSHEATKGIEDTVRSGKLQTPFLPIKSQAEFWQL